MQPSAEAIPLDVDRSGAYRVAGTRVTLACVAEMFREGASAEETAEQYDALRLADVYAVITYMLRHADEVAAYLTARRIVTEQVAAEADTAFPESLRSKLLAAKRERAASGC